jgi:hypothetical protein
MAKLAKISRDRFIAATRTSRSRIGQLDLEVLIHVWPLLYTQFVIIVSNDIPNALKKAKAIHLTLNSCQAPTKKKMSHSEITRRFLPPIGT